MKVKAGSDWKVCLRESLDSLNVLQSHADTLRANTSRYIRPILLVQVERTGKDQREKNVIHSESVRESPSWTRHGFGGNCGQDLRDQRAEQS